MWSKLFSDTVHEHFYTSASATDVDVEMLFLDEQLADFAKEPPVGSLVKFLDPDIVKRRLTAHAGYRVGCVLVVHNMLPFKPMFPVVV